MSGTPAPKPPSINSSNVNYGASGTNTWAESAGSMLSGYTITSISSSSNGQYLLATYTNSTLGAIGVSSDFGATWRNILNSNTSFFENNSYLNSNGAWTSSAMSSTGQVMWICSSDGYIYYSENYGNTWARKIDPTTYTSSTLAVNFVSIACSSNGQYVYACSKKRDGLNGGRVYVSSQFGIGPAQVPTGVGAGMLPDNTNWSSISCSSNGRVSFVCSSNGNIYATNRYGTSWYVQGDVTTGLPQGITWKSIAMSSTGQIITLSSSSGEVYKSIDYGYKFASASSFTPSITGANWNSIAMSSTGQYMLLSNSSTSNANNPVYLSSDQGQTWTQIAFTTNPTSVTDVAMSSSGQYLLTAGIIGSSKVLTASLTKDIGDVYGSQVALLDASQPCGIGMANTLGSSLYFGRNIRIEGNGFFNGSDPTNNGSSGVLNNDMYFIVNNISDGNSGTFYFKNGSNTTGPTINLSNDGYYGKITGANEIFTNKITIPGTGSYAYSGYITTLNGNAMNYVTPSSHVFSTTAGTIDGIVKCFQITDVSSITFSPGTGASIMNGLHYINNLKGIFFNNEDNRYGAIVYGENPTYNYYPTMYIYVSDANNSGSFSFYNSARPGNDTSTVYCQNLSCAININTATITFGSVGAGRIANGSSTGNGQFTIETDDNMYFLLNGSGLGSGWTGEFYFQKQTGSSSTAGAKINCGDIVCTNNITELRNITFYGGSAAGQIGIDRVSGQFTIETDDQMYFILNGTSSIGFLFQNYRNNVFNSYATIYCGSVSCQNINTNGYGITCGGISCNNINTNGYGIQADNISLTSSLGIHANAIQIYYFNGAAVIQVPATGLVGDGVPGTVLYLSASGRIAPQYSSARYKDDIVSLPDDRYNLETFMKLKPVQFVYKDSRTVKHIGFIAEELDALKLDEIVFRRDGVVESLDYTRIPIFLTKIVQEQQTKIEAQQAQIDDLTRKLQALTDLVNSKLV